MKNMILKKKNSILKKKNKFFVLIILTLLFTNNFNKLSFSLEKMDGVSIDSKMFKYISLAVLKKNQHDKEKNFFEYSESKFEGQEYIEKNYENIKYKTSKEDREKFLKEKLSEFGILNNKDFGIIYKSFVDGYEFKQNENDFFLAASTIKVPYVMLYDEDAKDDYYLDNTFLTYLQEDYQFGGGYITKGIDDGEIYPGDQFSLRRVLYETIVNSDNTTKGIISRYKKDIKKQILKYSDKKNLYIPETNMIKPIFMYDILDKIFYDENYKHTKTLMKQGQDYWQVSPSPNSFAKKYGWYDTTISEIGIVYDKRPYMIIIYKKNMPKYIDEKKPTILNDIGKIFYELNNLP